MKQFCIDWLVSLGQLILIVLGFIVISIAPWVWSMQKFGNPLIGLGITAVIGLIGVATLQALDKRRIRNIKNRKD